MIVVDASVLVDALLDDGPEGGAARGALAEDTEWAAPAHLPIEVLSVTRRKLLRGEVTLDRAADAVAALGESEVRWVDPQVIVDRVWQLRDNVTAFDAAYVAAAELLCCELLTGDARMASASGIRCPVRVIGRS